MATEYNKRSCPKYKQRSRADSTQVQNKSQVIQVQSKSYNVLVKDSGNAVFLLCFLFFEEVTSKFNKFLCCFQRDSTMFSFLVETLEESVRKICNYFILDDVMENSRSTITLMKLSWQKIPRSHCSQCIYVKTRSLFSGLQY